jgi:hypothetical protein
MTPKAKLVALALTAAASFAAPTAAAAAPVEVTGFTLSPSCVKPGGSVTANVTVQNSTYQAQTIFAQSWTTSYGTEVQTGPVIGPYTVPAFVPLSQSQTQTVPWYTPWGYYTVNFGVGPDSSHPRAWSQRSAPLVVSPFC